jgi:membrane-associated phospholipid phosphatase
VPDTPQRAYSRRSVALLWGAVVIGAALLGAMWALVAPGHALSIDRAAFRLLAFSPSPRIQEHGPKLIGYGTEGLVAVVVLLVLGLAILRRWSDATTIGVGYIGVEIVSYAMKEIVARPRPVTPVIYAGGKSFPSSDAALSVGFVAIALVLSRGAAEGRRRAAGGTAVALAALVGVLVIALRDHYLTDVIAGWGLGAMTFAGVALGADAIGRRRATAAAGRGDQ